MSVSQLTHVCFTSDVSAEWPDARPGGCRGRPSSSTVCRLGPVQTRLGAVSIAGIEKPPLCIDRWVNTGQPGGVFRSCLRQSRLLLSGLEVTLSNIFDVKDGSSSDGPLSTRCHDRSAVFIAKTNGVRIGD